MLVSCLFAAVVDVGIVVDVDVAAIVPHARALAVDVGLAIAKLLAEAS